LLSNLRKKKTMRFILLFLVCASMLGFRVVRAENVYVSPTGTGASDGSRSTPFSSLKTAMSRISPGDTLWLSEGRYEEPLKLVQKKGIRILPVEGAAVVIDGVPYVEPMLCSRGEIYHDSNFTEKQNVKRKLKRKHKAHKRRMI